MWNRCNAKVALSILVVGLVAGGTGGWFCTDRHLDQIWNQLIYSGVASEAQLDARILQKLRTGETDKAFAMLEAKLNGNLITIGAMSKHISSETMDEGFFSALDIIREYRKQYPHSGSTPHVQETLNKVLAIERPTRHVAP
jgi:hypothetical protein